MSYLIIKPKNYSDLAKQLIPKLDYLDSNRVTFKNEIHRTSRFAICHYKINKTNIGYILEYDRDQSVITSNQKKTNSDPTLLDDPIIKAILNQFLLDINDSSVMRAEVKLIQTETFPFEFNPHRDSQFRRLRNITYLATVIVSAGGIDGGNMQLFHSDNDKLGPFKIIEELHVEPGIGYIVDERPQIIFHGMKSAVKTNANAHRAALLIRFYTTPIGYQA